MRLLFLGFVLLSLSACTQKNKAPDVSNIKINITTQRFEQDLFALDTNNMETGMQQLSTKYGEFAKVFFQRIINVDPTQSKENIDSYVKSFLKAYKPVNDTVQAVFGNFKKYEDELKQGYRYVKYYFPNYEVPKQIITFVGPLDGFGHILLPEAVAIGLQQHIDSTYSLYDEQWLINTYPKYLTRNFIPATVSVMTFKNMIEKDLYPDKTPEATLIVQMVEAGKRLYVLEKILPEAPKHLLLGYTQKQYADCLAHERVIWDLFIQNDFLQSIDLNILKDYLGEGPKTAALGEGAPGNIGSFAGWRIVEKFMEEHSNMTPQQLLNYDPEKLYTEAKYKP